MKDKLMKISYIFMAFVVAGVVLFHSLTAPVMAANEITSLPMIDVDVECSYDDQYVYMAYNNKHYRILRSHPIKQEFPDYGTGERFLIGYKADGIPRYGFSDEYSHLVPEFTDKESTGFMAPLSMWFSAKEMRIYYITGTSDTDGVFSRGMIKSYYGSGLVFYTSASYAALNYYDLSDGSFHLLGLISLKGGSAENLGVIPTMYVSSSGFIDSYVNENGESVKFPTDLICVYSNYEISGYFEFGGEDGSIYAPKYYFDFQYIFYVEDVGYTFIDSARPLVDIVDNKDGYVYLDFSETCNRRVWTSPDGISWSYANYASAMLGDLLQMPYKYFLDNVGGSIIAKLVYTTDLDYNEDPIVKPEYGDINDVVADLNNIVFNGGPLPSDRGDNYTLDSLDNMRAADYAEFVAYGFTHQYYKRITVVYDDGSIEHIYDIESGRWGSTNRGDRTFSYLQIDYVPTIAMYLYDLNLTLDDTNKLLESVKITLHNDLKSVFDNITLSNYYLESLDSTLAALPDYSKKLDDILITLDNLEVKVPTTGTTTVLVDLSPLQEYLIDIDDTSEIQELLLELDKSIDNVAKIEVFDEITDSTDIAGDVVDNVFDEVFDFEKAPELSKGADEVSGMISGAIGQLATGSILIGAFDYASNITSGVGFINANVNNFYEASSVMKPVFLSGAAMFVVNLVLRRKE